MRLKERGLALRSLQCFGPILEEPARSRNHDLRHALGEDGVGDVVDLQDTLNEESASCHRSAAMDRNTDNPL